MKLKLWATLGLALFTLTGTATAANPTYVGAEKCKLCHKVEYASWLTTKHAKAYEALSPANRAKPECIRCHITGNTKDLPGVQCEACHGPGSDYKSLTIMKSREKSTAAGLILPTEKTCTACHNSKSPQFKSFNYAEMVKKVHDKKTK